MSIAAEELKLYRDSAGRLSSNQINNGFKNGLYPDITQAQRTAGITLTEKSFYKVANAAGTQGINSRCFIVDITPGGGHAVLYVGTQRNKVTDLTGSERKYGASRLVGDVIATATSITVDAEPGNGANLIFQAGDIIYIDDYTSNEFAVIDSVVWTVDQAVITLTQGLENPYLAATPTRVSSCISSATIETSIDNWVETSSAGVYDEVGNAVVNDNIGGVEETWTLTFTSTTDFTVTGDTVGSIGNGSIAANFTPQNPDFSKAYFSLLAAGFSGSWAINDTLVFQTHPATQPLFSDLIIPPGTAAYSNDDITIGMIIESA